MAQRVKMPDGSVAEFPDSMTPEQITAAIRAHNNNSPTPAPAAAGQGFNRQLSLDEIMSGLDPAANADRFNAPTTPASHEVPQEVLNPIDRPNAQPGLGQRDPQVMQGFLNSYLNGLTFNLADDFAGIVGGPDARENFNADIQHLGDVAGPGATMVSSLAGGAPWMGVGGGWAMGAPSMIGKIGRGAAVGGLTGGAYGYGAGEGGPLSADRMESMFESIPLPALLGGAAAPIGATVGAIWRGFGNLARRVTGRADEVLPPARTIDELFAGADEVYGQLRSSGVTAPREAVNQSYSRLVDRLHTQGVADELPIVRQVDAMFNRKQFGFDDLERIRRRASRGMVAVDGEERFAAGLIFDEVNDLILDTMGDLPAAARDLYARAMKAETLQGMIYRAEVRSENGSPSFEQALRAQVSQMLLREHGTRGFTPEEVSMLRAFNSGTTFDKFQRALARLDPSRSVVAAAFSGAGLAGGAPEMLALGIGGRLARGNLDRTSRGRFNRISEAVRRGVNPHPQGKGPYLLPPAVQGGASVYGAQNAPAVNFLNNPASVFGGFIQAR